MKTSSLIMTVAMLGLVGCSGTQLAQTPQRPDPGELAGLTWLTGSWMTEAGIESGRRAEEHWTVAAGGSMIGMNRTIQSGGTVFFEYLRIAAAEGSVRYLASPLGRYPPTPFQLGDSSESHAVFENPEHDFPQRIGYRLVDKDTLEVWIEGEQNGETRTERWKYHRVEWWD